MRRTAALLLLLLTTRSAQAGVSDDILINPLNCCSALLFVSALAFVILLAIHDWRKARRPAPPPE